MPRRQHPGGHPALDGDRQPKQPDHVGDHRTRPSYPDREFVVGDVEFLEQLLIGRRLFQRIQLRAVDVLQQGVPEHVVIGGLADDRRNGGQSGLLQVCPGEVRAGRVQCGALSR